MKKIVVSLAVALLTFIVLNFFYSNVGGEAFQYPLSFRFTVPYLFTMHTLPVPLGFMLIATFCLGMVFLPVLQLVPAIFRGAMLRAREKRIRELERELEVARVAGPATPGEESDAASSTP